MKKTLLLIQLLFITIYANSQTKRLDFIITSDNNFKITYTYDANNVFIKSNTFQLSNGSFELQTETIFNYDSNGRVNEIIEKYIDNGNLVNSSKRIYSYDTNSNIETETVYRWTNNNWVQTDEYQMTYNSNNLITQRILANNTKIEYIYSGANLITKEIYYWNTADNQWNAYAERKFDFTYDVNNNRTVTVKSIYYNGNWTESQRIEYSYNNSFTENNLILPYYTITDEMNLSFNHQITNVIGYEYDNGNWVNTATLEFNYSDVAKISEEVFNNLIIYPNPTNNIVNFKVDNFDNISIYSISGKLIVQSNINLVDMSKLPDGVYIYKIKKGNDFIIGKIIKK